jgi:aspartate racemase
MKTIGLIGGLTWLSTLDYYRFLNQQVNEMLGGVEAAKIIIYSVNFGEIKVLTEEDRWDEIAALISVAAKKLKTAGADCILIGANTMHRIAGQVQSAVKIPVIHIADETAKVILEKNLEKVALLGTKYTMQLDFYTKRLSDQGIETIIPVANDIEIINTAIYNEMSRGIFREETKTEFLRIIDLMVKQGAQGIILGCTEIPILVKPEDCPVPVFDTTLIHTKAAVAFALS